jgi:hypothetical protein
VLTISRLPLSAGAGLPLPPVPFLADISPTKVALRDLFPARLMERLLL